MNGSDNEQLTLEGLYVQGPRVRPWFVPGARRDGRGAAARAHWPGSSCSCRPCGTSPIDEASQLDAIQQAELDERVAAIEAAAEEASQLPLGQPTDLRLSVSAAAATTATEAFDFDQSGSGRVFSISDVIFQNPTGAVGRVELLRDDQVLLDQEMANFRDLDFHLVAPFRVDSRSTISLRVTCQTPGPGTESCEAAATIIGFVDDA